MPGFTTHYILGLTVYNQLPSSRTKYLIAKHKNLFQLGLQGPDIFFYNLPILRHRDYRNVGSYMHENHVNRFFQSYIKKLCLMKSEHLRNQALSYLCGFICHYIGDHICHPYVYGRIHYDPQHPSNTSYGRHAALENEIDAILLKKYKDKKPSEFNQAATIALNPQELQFLSSFMADCINETYYKITYKNSFQISSKSVRLSIMAIKWGCRTLSDPSGKKASRIKFFEKFILEEPLVSSKLVTNRIEDVKVSMNLEHEPWYNPWDKSVRSTESFPELFEKCQKLCCQHMKTLDNCLLKSATLKYKDFQTLLTELGSYSYHSGLPVL